MSNISSAEIYGSHILRMAQELGWQIVFTNAEKKLIHLHRRGVFMDVYCRSYRVITCMKHPRMGISMLERKNMSLNEAYLVLQDPRVHLQNLGRIIFAEKYTR